MSFEQQIIGSNQLGLSPNSLIVHCISFLAVYMTNTIFGLCIKGNAIQAFGNGTDVSVWHPMPPVQTTTSMTTPSQRARDKDRSPNAIEPATHINHLSPADNSLYQFCGNIQVSGTIAYYTHLQLSCMY